MLKGNWKSGENQIRPYLHMGQFLLGEISLILSEVYVVKLGDVSCLLLDLLGHFSAGIDPMALEEPKMLSKLHFSTLYLLSKPSIISQWG
jgi:hypothetical protein